MTSSENNQGASSSDGWRVYHRGDDPRPDVEWSGYLHDEAERGPAIAYADATGEPLFIVWWDDFGNCNRITHWRPLPAELSAPATFINNSYLKA